MKALIIADIQVDFCPGGALPVLAGDETIPVVNALQPRFDLVVATQDWHPQNHGSFASNNPGRKVFDRILLGGMEQVLWPDHCVQGTRGAEFAPGLDMNRVEAIFRKGTDPAIDSYSAFFDNARRKSTGLGDYLKGRGVRRVFVAGLTGEFCVFYTARDAVSLGFETYYLREATRALDRDAFLAAQETLRGLGVRVIDRPS